MWDSTPLIRVRIPLRLSIDGVAARHGGEAGIRLGEQKTGRRIR
jgi:hypothetical protein